ncbi:unnamed protein product [Symbiodinium sp. CCMP2592]|nr:unnamed protein product [Symbiodinium sp. CCMP2592]
MLSAGEDVEMTTIADNVFGSQLRGNAGRKRIRVDARTTKRPYAEGPGHITATSAAPVAACRRKGRGSGPFTEKDDEEAYGKTDDEEASGRLCLYAPYGDDEEAYGKIVPLRRSLAGLGPFTEKDGLCESLAGLGPFTEKDDEEAYGKTSPLRGRGRGLREDCAFTEPVTGREGPYGKGQSLRGGSLTGLGPFTEKDDEEAYGKIDASLDLLLGRLDTVNIMIRRLDGG